MLKETEQTQLNLFNTNTCVPKNKLVFGENLNFKEYFFKRFDLTIKKGDNLYDKFQKMAYLLATSNLVSSDKLCQYAKILYPFLGYNDISIQAQDSSLLESNRITLQIISESECRNKGLIFWKQGTYNFAIKFQGTSLADKTEYLIITDANNMLNKRGDIYTLAEDEKCYFTYISKDLLIGYGKLVDEILTKYKSVSNCDLQSQYNMLALLTGLISACDTQAYMNYYNEAIFLRYVTKYRLEEIRHTMNYYDSFHPTGDTLFGKDNVRQLVDDYITNKVINTSKTIKHHNSLNKSIEKFDQIIKAKQVYA